MRGPLLIGLAVWPACNSPQTVDTRDAADISQARLAFTLQPADVVVDHPLPTIRLEVADPDGTHRADARGRVEVTLGLNPIRAELTGPHTFDLTRGVTELEGLAVNVAANGFTLFASWRGLTAQSAEFDVVEDFDRVHLTNRAEATVGFLASGATGERSLESRTIARSNEALIPVGVFRPVGSDVTRRFGAEEARPRFSTREDRSRILAFSHDRAPVLLDFPPWTTGVDTVELAFSAPVPIDLTVWVVHGHGNAEALRRPILEEVLLADAIWRDERIGIAIGELEIIDATSHPGQLQFYQRESTHGLLDSLRSVIGERAGRFNVYSVHFLGWGDRSFSGIGQLGGTLSAIVGSGWRSAILAHELGHNFGLRHVDGDPRFDETNVMHSASSVRQYMSEGQTFGVHYGPSPLVDLGLNHAFAALPPPPLELRLWPDGRFPASIRRGVGRAPPDLRLARSLAAGSASPAGSGPQSSSVERMLLTDCGLDVLDGAGAKELLAMTRGALVRAIEEGPPPVLLERVRRTAVGQYRLTRRHLAAGWAAWLGPADRERLASVSEAEYVADLLARFDGGFRERARHRLGGVLR